MLNIVDITEDNMEKYHDIIPEQYLQDIGREYIRGIAGVDSDTNEPCGGMIWEVHNLEQDDLENKAEILWFSAKNTEDAGVLLDVFDIMTGDEDVISSYFEMEGLSDEETAALKKAGFSTEQAEGTDVYVTVEETGKLDIAKKKAENYVVSLSKVSSFKFKAGIMNSVYHGRYGILGDLPYLPMSWFDSDLSCCVMTDDKVAGLLLVHLLKPALYRVELLFSEELDGAISVLNMLRFSIHAAKEKCDPEDEILIRRHNRTVTGLCKKLFPEKKGKQVIRGTR